MKESIDNFIYYLVDKIANNNTEIRIQEVLRKFDDLFGDFRQEEKKDDI